jgi:hypothetical protein
MTIQIELSFQLVFGFCIRRKEIINLRTSKRNANHFTLANSAKSIATIRELRKPTY